MPLFVVFIITDRDDYLKYFKDQSSVSFGGQTDGMK